MRFHEFGKTGYHVSIVGYGGIISSQNFGGAFIPGDGQKMSDHYIAWAVEQGINYFDVAPSYGDAQELMGNSLRPWRNDIYLACKTNKRLRVEAEIEMLESLKFLHTDYFDVYQLHGLTSVDEVEICFGPGGTMELLAEMKEKGIARKIGFTAHNENAALKALALYDFDTVMFPFNWHMHMAHEMGERIRNAAKEKGLGILGIKSMIEKAWDDQERFNSAYPKSWCKPFDVTMEPEYLLAALKYTVSLGVDILVPPGNYEHFKFAVEHIDDVLDHPFSDTDHKLLANHLPKVRDFPFYDSDCYAK